MRRVQTLAAAGVVAIIGITASPAVGMADTLPLDSYGAAVDSWGLDIRVIAIAQAGTIPDLADEYFPHTKVTVDSLPHATADGEFFDPGATVRIGPNLANNILLGPHGVPPVIPNYPYIASTTSDGSAAHDVNRSATEPMTPEPGLPTVGIPILKPGTTGFGAATAKAHADKTPYADAVGTVASVNLGLINVGSIAGESSAKQAKSVVTATTTTTMNGIDIAKVGSVALLHIGSEVATATITTSGPGTAKAAQSVTYSGVTVAGLPATIDDTGLHVGGSGVSAAAAQTALTLLTTTLAKGGFVMVAPHATGTTNADGSATSVVDGFGFSYTDKKNITASISLAHAELKARALPGTPFAPSSSSDAGSAGSGFFDNSLGFFYPGSAGTIGSGARRAPRVTTVINQAGGFSHLLILPFVAIVAELSMMALVVKTNRMRRLAQVDPEDLLAL